MWLFNSDTIQIYKEYNQLTKMDYNKLYAQLPKQPIKWTVSDIKIWLQFIGLESLYESFKEHSIDGSCLSSLNEQDLREELKIKSGITVKKIMSWTTKGLKEYNQFLKMPMVDMAGAAGVYEEPARDNTQKSKNQYPSSNSLEGHPNLIKQSSYKSVPGISNKKDLPPPGMNKVFSSGEAIKVQNEGNMIDEGQQQNQEELKQYELIIQQCDGNQNSFYSVKEDGAKIGRHSTNQILILQESISRFHAEIKFADGKFYIKDSGSTTGTFLKIFQKTQILPGMILEMGSNQFQARFINGILTLEVIEGPSVNSVIEIQKNSKVTMGRKQTNLLNFPDDQHLSNTHAIIFSIGDKYYLEDMGTTNGSWQRLSIESQASGLFELFDKSVFKFGSNQTYTCKIRTSVVSEKTLTNACIICMESDKDCVYLPCKHNVACIKCSKNLKECPICRSKIQDFVRIYKA